MALPALTLPPYKILILSATTAPYISRILVRIAAHTSCACSAVATLPVPIAHIGSYAIIQLITFSGGMYLKALTICFLINSSVTPLSRCSRLSPQQRIWKKLMFYSFPHLFINYFICFMKILSSLRMSDYNI